MCLVYKKQKQPPDVFFKEGVLRNFAKFARKHLCQSLFFNKDAGLQLVCNFIKKETLAQVLSCEFCEISKNTFFKEHMRWLLLSFVNCLGYLSWHKSNARELRRSLYLLWNLHTVFLPIRSPRCLFYLKAVRCSSYWRATLRRRRLFFKSDKKFTWNFKT